MNLEELTIDQLLNVFKTRVQKEFLLNLVVENKMDNESGFIEYEAIHEWKGIEAVKEEIKRRME